MALRQSKYKHVRGSLYRPENQFPNLFISSTSGDGTLLAASREWISVLWSTNTGGSVGILGVTEWGGRSKNVPIIHAHSAQINDLAWNPFHDWMLATAAADGNVRLWKLPEAGLTGDVTSDKATATLSPGAKRVDCLAWHPSAANVLASGGPNNIVSIWDVTSNSEKIKLSKFTDCVDGVAWKYDGSMLATTSRDKKVRLCDPRSADSIVEAAGHQGPNKPSRVTFFGKYDKFVTTGYSQTRDREFKIWDTRNLSSALKTQILDASPGCLVPMFDADTDLLFLSGRGDSTIRTFECSPETPFFYELNPVVDKTPHRGVCMSPKFTVDLMAAEVVRLLKATTNAVIPIGYTIPRKTYREFHADLYPNSAGPDPALMADEWFGGSNKPPIEIEVKPAGNVKVAEIPYSVKLAETKAAPVKAPSAPGSPAPHAHQPHVPATTSHPQSSPTPGSKNVFDKKVEVKQEDEYYIPKEMNIVRSTHYRHIFGKPEIRVNCYDDLKVLNDAMQTRNIRVNKTWMGVTWQGVGGRLGVFNIDKDRGRVTPPTIKGVDTVVSTIEVGANLIDFDFNPFDDNLLATGAENAIIKLWKIPPEGIKSQPKNKTDADGQLKGHQHKIISVDFHPYASNLLVSTSGDLTAKFWDINAMKDSLTVKGFGDLVNSVAWNYDATIMGAASKDRKIRIIDPRSDKVMQECPDLGGALGSKIDWCGKQDKIVVVGFNKQSERRIQLLDLKNLSKPLADERIDFGSATLTPLFDPDTGVLLMWGKGEGKVIFYEINDSAPYVHPLTEYTTTVPQIGLAFQHKTQCDVKEVEIFKAFKLTQDTVDPVSFRVPRQRKEFFQDDIFTLTPAKEPVYTCSEWLEGAKKEPKLISLKPKDMQALSDAPKIVRMAKKFKEQGPEEDDIETVKNKLVDKFYQQMLDHREDENEPMEHEKPSDEVNDDEWD